MNAAAGTATVRAGSSAGSSSKLPPTYYITSRTLNQHVGRTCRLVGQVLQVTADGVRAQIEAPDGGVVTVVRQAGSPMYASKFVSVTGVVLADMTLRESIFESFGDNFNVAVFYKTISLMPQTPALFALM